MRVQDVMSTDVRTVSAGTSADEAWNLMQVEGIHHLVVTRAGVVVGVLSDRDLGGRRGTAVRRARTSEELMTRAPVTVAPTTTVRKAANLMRGRSIGCLVVLKGERVSGIVTVADLLELIGHGTERPASKGTRASLRHRVPHRHRTAPAAAW